MIVRLILASLLLAGCSAPRTGDTLDAIAADFVKMSLEAGERSPGYVDAYYGPPEWQAAAKSNPRAISELAAEARRLSARVDSIDADGLEPIELRRRDHLKALLTAADTRLRMLQGEKFSFAEEARGLFGVAPELKPLAELDPVLARIEAMVPGAGPLADRVEAFRDRFNIAPDRLRPVFDAAIAECKRRSAQHIPLPQGESFDLHFVTGKSWSGYNYYQGNYRSRIEINTDLPVRIDRALDLGCHEGYPGHHVTSTVRERDLSRGRKWAEFQILPLFAPVAIVYEGTGNHGIDLAFPGAEKLAFETRILYPLAGLPTAEAATYDRLLRALDELAPARYTIARQLLDGEIDEAEAVRLAQRYQLVSAERAKQLNDFTREYRTYVINYGLGEELARAAVEAAGPSQAARWARMKAIIAEPTLPNDLQRMARASR